MKIALIQMNSDERRARNLQRAESLVREAAGMEPDLVALPESFPYLAPEEETLPFAEEIPGPATDMLAGLCREYGFYVLAGSIPEKTKDAERYLNTSALIGPDGSIRAKYSKVHLFDIDIPGEITNKESSHVVPGHRPVTAEAAGSRIGLSICYDLRFPEFFRVLALEGAEIVFVPSAFASFTGRAHWEVLLRARAIENQVFVAAPAQCGRHQSKTCYGNSMIVDPWGTVIARAGDSESVLFAELDMDNLERVRRQNPCLRNIRSLIGEIKWIGDESRHDSKPQRNPS